MKWIAILPLAALLLAGCQAHPKATTAQAAAAPKVIVALSDQKVIYECPQCGMDYDAPGKCTMDDAVLEKTDVAYICPADNKPVDKAGPCPRCNVNARIVKTAVAASSPAPGTPASGAAGAGASSGS